MTNKSHSNMKIKTVALGILVLLLCLFSYFSAPQSATFLEAINPWNSLVGLTFILTYFGLPVPLAILVEVLLLLLLLYLLHRLVRCFFRR